MIKKNMILQEKDGIKYFKFMNLELPGIYAQGVTTRHSGNSQHPFASLNLGYFLGDRDKSVAENRQLFERALRLNNTVMITADQIHSNKVSIVTESVRDKNISPNGGWEDPRRAVRMTDALITRLKNVTLNISTADCVPILIYDLKQNVIAAVHAGWKGTGLEITARTVYQMMQTFNVKPENCQVAFGPSIGICCYNIDVKVIDFFRAKFTYWRDLFSLEKNNQGKLNLEEANRRQLLSMGIPDRNIVSCEVCTSCHNDLFFSFRKENGNTGRQMTFIAMGGQGQ
ncbi:MAG: peptidoglycan editing factor PgeF [Candidatus Firestonebacteria bacterium]|nr:peptidoglycan editing factor PgeF [Candidatus Firestonebacteria bacterium]